LNLGYLNIKCCEAITERGFSSLKSELPDITIEWNV